MSKSHLKSHLSTHDLTILLNIPLMWISYIISYFIINNSNINDKHINNKYINDKHSEYVIITLSYGIFFAFLNIIFMIAGGI